MAEIVRSGDESRRCNSHDVVGRVARGAGVPTWLPSAMECVLDHSRERKPKDPTIPDRFNSYRFADHKENVMDLLDRVCAASTFTRLLRRGWVLSPQ